MPMHPLPEVGHKVLKEGISIDAQNLVVTRREYSASEGTEIFLAKEEPHLDVLIGYLRLRIPSLRAHRPEVDDSTAIVRELHVYGPEVPIGRESPHAWQHKGVGQELLSAAECAAKAEGARKILVLSALGTKEYYKKSGYSCQGAYMTKLL